MTTGEAGKRLRIAANPSRPPTIPRQPRIETIFHAPNKFVPSLSAAGRTIRARQKYCCVRASFSGKWA